MMTRILRIAALVALAPACSTYSGVLTQRVNNARTGAYLFEGALTHASVSSGRFGRLYERNVDGQTLANVLVVFQVPLPGRSQRNLFYIATAKNCVYAFDLDDTTPDGPPPASDTACMVSPALPDLSYRDPAGHCNVSTKAIWTRDLGPAGCAPVCEETWPKRVGVTSTPVIDANNPWMFVVSYHVDTRQHFLHKIDIATGLDVQAAIPIGGSVGGKTFNAACARNRPGLLLQNGNVYVGFACLSCDAWCSTTEPYYGWVLGYRESDLAPTGVYNTALDGAEMGIWQSGNGLVGDGRYIYFMTGNESSGVKGDSFVRIDTMGGTLADAGFFQPANHDHLKAGDADLGSSGPILLPGGKLLGGGKEGRLHVVDASMTGPDQD